MTKENKQPEAFAALLGELETLSKAAPAEDGKDDAKIQAAAEGGGDADAGKEGAEGEMDADGKPMAKSMMVTLADGTTVEAEDGTELVKSLIERLDGTETVMAKALGAAVDLIKGQASALAKTTELVKSLQAKVTELSGEGKGRKTVLTVHEKAGAGDTLQKSEPAGISGEEFMVKALAAQKAGKLTGLHVSIAEASLNRGVPIPQHIQAAVFS